MGTRTIKLRLAGYGQHLVDIQLVIQPSEVEIWCCGRMRAALDGDRLLAWLESPSGACATGSGAAFVANGHVVCLYIRELVPVNRLSGAVVKVLRESLQAVA